MIQIPDFNTMKTTVETPSGFRTRHGGGGSDSAGTGEHKPLFFSVTASTFDNNRQSLSPPMFVPTQHRQSLEVVDFNIHQGNTLPAGKPIFYNIP